MGLYRTHARDSRKEEREKFVEEMNERTRLKKRTQTEMTKKDPMLSSFPTLPTLRKINSLRKERQPAPSFKETERILIASTTIGVSAIKRARKSETREDVKKDTR